MPYDAQTLFIRLLTLVDDFGRYDADFRLLRSHAFPFGDPFGKEIKAPAIEKMCEFLSAGGLVTFYSKDGKQFLQIERWSERARADKSKYPASDNTCAQMFANDSKCLLPSPSPSPSFKRHSSNGSQANTFEPSDEEWIRELAKSKAYQGIDVPREFSKMEHWCKTARKNPSRRRFINWLNKCERPIHSAKNAPGLDPAKIELPTEFKVWVKGKYPTKQAELEGYKTWADVPDWMRVEWRREKIVPLTRSIAV